MQRSILITGCSSGIGLAAARAMRDRNWRVFATARAAEDLESLRRDEHLEPVHLELRDHRSIAACASEVIEKTGGRLDALFNNAAFGQPGAMEDLPTEALRDQFEVNVIGTHDLTRHLIPSLLCSDGGRIVQCSSVLGLIAAPYRGAYCASKFALEAMSDVLRIELENTRIAVSIIEPGPINTRFIDGSLAAARRWINIPESRHRSRYEAMIAALERGGKQTFKLEPEAVAAKLVHAAEARRPRRRYYVTTPTYMAAAARRILPTSAIDWLAARN